MFEDDWKIKIDYLQWVKLVNPSRSSSNFHQKLNIINVQMFHQILTN